ncbi:hypothetical protein HMPREF9554_00140 [Treponema phagedenis F0421]|nr:hypothetical protein HMPREF9554_00140 [Treponema phagedenis F0421]
MSRTELTHKQYGSFQTHRFGFDMDVKTQTGTDAPGSKQQRRFKAKLFAKLLNSQGIILPSMAKLYRFYSLN